MKRRRLLSQLTRNLGPRGVAAVATGLYLLLGLAWTVPSDLMVLHWVSDPRLFEWIHLSKATAYITLTAGLVYLVALWFARALDENQARLKRQREHLSQLNRAHATLTRVSEALLHGLEDQSLLESAARAIVEEGGFPFVWIGLYDPASGELTPRAAAGSGGGSRALAEPFAVTSADRSMIARAIHRGHWSRGHRGDDPRLDRLAPPDLGDTAVAAFPLRGTSESRGLIVIHSLTADLFEDEDEVRLLSRVADTLSLGLEYSHERRMLHRMNQHDPVTGVGNRGFIEGRLEAALNNAARRDMVVAIMVLDVDDFRAVTDAGGEAAGNAVLAGVVRSLSRVVRPGDAIGRLGRDEFALVCQDLAGTDQASRLVSRVGDCFPVQVEHGGESFPVSVSIGVAVYPEDARDAAELLARAELALQSQPADAVAAITYYAPEFDRRASEQRALEQALRDADFDREFRLAWQPVVDPGGPRLVAAEVLLRWHHRELGEIPPDRFIPLAERSGQIRALGRRVLEEACRQADTWARAGHAIDVAVNIALEQLQDPGFVPHIERLLQGAAPGWRLVIELTETQFMEDPEPVISTCRQLRALGCRIHLDDFGTGYSALHYLVHLPLDGLKIDRSFIQQIETDAGVRAITRAVVSLAARLELGVIAEGVETAGQLRLVCEMGDCLVQGHFFGDPVAAGELENWHPPDVSQLNNRAAAT